jgi:hypothetical protein
METSLSALCNSYYTFKLSKDKGGTRVDVTSQVPFSAMLVLPIVGNWKIQF